MSTKSPKPDQPAEPRTVDPSRAEEMYPGSVPRTSDTDATSAQHQANAARNATATPPAEPGDEAR